MNAPFFSIVIPLYNKEPYIAKTLDSVLAQELGDYEVLVVNDGSKDGGAAIVRQYAEKDARIRLIEQENAGVSVARNTGIAHAQGQYVAFLDADDWWEPNHLTELKTLARTYPEAGMLCTAYRRVHAKPPHVDILHRKLKGQRLLVDYFEKCLKFQFIYTSSISIKRDLLAQQEISFLPGVTHGEDLDMWARIAVQTSVAHSATVTVNYNCAVPDSAVRMRTAKKASPYPVLTYGKILLAMPVEDASRKVLQKLADRSAFPRALKVHSQHEQSLDDYLDEIQYQQWSQSCSLKLLNTFRWKPLWRGYAFLTRCVNSRALHRLKVF